MGIDLLRHVYDMEEPEKAIEFEYSVKLDHVSSINGYIRETRVPIEQIKKHKNSLISHIERCAENCAKNCTVGNALPSCGSRYPLE